MESTLITVLSHTAEFNDPKDLHTQVHKTGARVELMIHCTDLVSLDEFSKDDPMCVLFVKQFGQWKEYKRTEAVKETYNPKFTETFILDYDHDSNLPLMFSVYDIDNSSTDLRNHDHVGAVEITLSQLLKPDLTITTTSRSLRTPGDPSSRGWIHITAEVVRESRSVAHFHTGASKLKKKGVFAGKSSTVIQLSKSVNSVHFHPVYRSETVFKSSDPRWRPFKVSTQKLCNGDLERPIQFSVWCVENNNQRSLKGQVVTTVRELESYRGRSCQTLALTKPHKHRKKEEKSRGILKFFLFKVDMQYSLMDYIRGGCQLKFMLAIDFTSSNGDPTELSSLHNVSGATDNQYIEAIKTLGSMLSCYDMDKNFPTYGFGCKLDPKLRSRRKRKDCFPLNGKPDSPCITGIEGILATYKAVVPKLKFSGPSKLAPCLRKAMDLAKRLHLSQENQSYLVMLIITDGVVNDLNETVDALIASSVLPMSVVIACVGPSNYTMMDQLHYTPDKPLKSFTSSRTASRENVHFAVLKHTGLLLTKQAKGKQTAVARETMARLSSQFVAYMKDKGLTPNRPVLHRTDPSHGPWVDETTDLDDHSEHNEGARGHDPLGLTGRKVQYTNHVGPTCPTCGAFMESGDDPSTLDDLDLTCR